MADHTVVKMEPHDSQPIVNNGASTDDDDGPLPAWKDCNDENLFKQVQIKELAVTNGAVFLGKLYMALKNHLQGIPTCEWRMERISMLHVANILNFVS